MYESIVPMSDLYSEEAFQARSKSMAVLGGAIAADRMDGRKLTGRVIEVKNSEVVALGGARNPRPST